MFMWQPTCTSQSILGSLFVLPVESGRQADDLRGHYAVRWHR